MHQRNEADLIRKYFHYLFDEYGFTMIDVRHFNSYSDWVAVLASNKCRLRFIEDRGTVMLAVGPLWDPLGWEAGPWFELPIVTAYLNQGIFTWEYDQLGPTEPQLRSLADLLRPYIDQICTMFSPDNFPKHEDNLRRLYDERYGDHLEPGKHT